MTDIGLKNHYVSEQALNRRLQLQSQWNDTGIIDCTREAAEIILTYKLVEKQPGKDYVHFGKALFFWDSHERALLHCVAQENERVYRTLAILSDGSLHFDGEFYLTPQKFLEELTVQKHLVFTRVGTIPKMGLEKVLNREVDSEFVFKYPPDYPPLLLELALANHDYATAGQILDNKSINDATSLKMSPKAHLLKCAIESTIAGRHDHFLKYLIEKYDLLNAENANSLEVIKGAILSNQKNLFIDLWEKFPQHQLSVVGSYAMEVSVELNSPSFSTLILDRMGKQIPLQVDEKRLFDFFTRIYSQYDGPLIIRIVEKLGLEIPWKMLIPELIKNPVDSEKYLAHFKAAGGDINQFDPQVQIELIQRALVENKLSRLLTLYPSLSNHLNDALLQTMGNEKSVDELILLGAKPSLAHFDKLLEVTTLGPERLQRFLKLMETVSSVEEAKVSLAITSAYGEEALVEVLKKFPELAGDRIFLASLLQHTWKGAIYAATQLTTDMLTIKSEGLPHTDRALPKEQTDALMERFSSSAKIGVEMSMEILIDILAKEGQVDKIGNLLIQKPEYIYEFWWRLLFAFYIDVNVEKWTALTKITFPLLDAEKQERLLFCAFRYFNPALAYLWMSCCTHITPSDIIDCFTLGVPSADPRVVDVLADLGYLNVRDQYRNTLLHLAVEENASTMIIRLLERGIDPELGNIFGTHAYDIALKKGQVTSCCLIRSSSCLDQIAENWRLLDPSKLEPLVVTAFLNSNSQDVLRLIVKMRLLNPSDSKYIEIFDSLEHYIRYPGTLIVRYPRPAEQYEVFKGYNTGQKSYEELQFSWGNRCEELYQNFYKDFKNNDHTVLGALIKFAKERAHLPGYEAWRMGYYNQMIGLTTHFHWRYFIYWHLAIKVYKALLIHAGRNDKVSAIDPDMAGVIDNPGLKLDENGYQVFFMPESGEPIPLTRIQLKRPIVRGLFRARIIHTFPTEVKRVLPHLSELFEKIKNYPRNHLLNELPLELKKMIAHFFWLGIHTSITERGNSQYMLMLHRLLYNIHGFQAAPWNPLYVQPDCIALLLPFEFFYEKYYDALFDFPPKSDV